MRNSLQPAAERLARVVIVLCTYNGARYLPEQLQSLSAQTFRPNRLVVRDDGSTDDTLSIVRAWAEREGVEIQVLTGPRLGPARSFLEALKGADEGDLFLFCDQDDVWLPTKIERALGLVPWGAGALPALCATRLDVVDASLQPLGQSPVPQGLSFGSAACESLLTGCTMAFNAPFRSLLVRQMPQHVAMHDWWCYLVATGIQGATLQFDPTPSLLYRQHGNNLLGAKREGIVERTLRFGGRNSRVRSAQLDEFQRIYAGELTPFAKELTSGILASRYSFGMRLKTAAFAGIRRQTFLSTVATRLSLLLNRF